MFRGTKSNIVYIQQLGIWSDFCRNCFSREKKQAVVCEDLIGLALGESGVCSVNGIGFSEDKQYVIQWELSK